MIQIVHVGNACDVFDFLDGTERLISLHRIARLQSHLKWLKAAIFDFDGTLTSGSQWAAVGDLMIPELRERDRANRDWYYSHSRASNGSSGSSLHDPDWWVGHLHTGNMPVAEGAWVATTIAMLQCSCVTLDQIERAAKAVEPRQGAIELLRMFESRAVISMGIEQLIVRWLLNHNVPSPVAATRLICNEQRNVDGCHINVLASESKRFAADRFREITRVRDEQIMVVGDSIVDASMMRPNGFNILLIPPNETNTQIDSFRRNNLSVMLENVTAVLVSDSLQPLVDLIKIHRNGTRDA